MHFQIICKIRTGSIHPPFFHIFFRIWIHRLPDKLIFSMPHPSFQVATTTGGQITTTIITTTMEEDYWGRRAACSQAFSATDVVEWTQFLGVSLPTRRDEPCCYVLYFLHNHFVTMIMPTPNYFFRKSHTVYQSYCCMKLYHCSIKNPRYKPDSKSQKHFVSHQIYHLWYMACAWTFNYFGENMVHVFSLEHREKAVTL